MKFNICSIGVILEKEETLTPEKIGEKLFEYIRGTISIPTENPESVYDVALTDPELDYFHFGHIWITSFPVPEIARKNLFLRYALSDCSLLVGVIEI